MGCPNPLKQIIEDDVAEFLVGEITKYPEINLKRLDTDTDIPSGGSVDFENVRVGATPKEIYFRIENKGDADLNLTGDTRVEITGQVFVVPEQPDSPIKSDESQNFTIRFTPTAVAGYSETVTIKNDDSDEGTYEFIITGAGVDPDIIITQDGDDIVNGGEYDFGNFDAGNNVDVTFTIENLGEHELQLTGSPLVDITGTDASIFSVTYQPAITSITTGNSTNFTVRFSPDNGGDKQAQVDIANDDPDENPYSFSIIGFGVVANPPVVSGISPTFDMTPTWTWTSGGGGSGTYRYKLDDSDLTSGATETTNTSYTPSSPLSLGNHILYVQESNDYPEWSSSGSYTIEVTDVFAIGWIGGGSNGWKSTSGASTGTDYQSFRFPRGVYLDSSGNIYVADYLNHRISKWNSSGNAIGWIGGGSNNWKTTSGASQGSDFQRFRWPYGVFVDSSGNIYVADKDGHRISKWQD